MNWFKFEKALRALHEFYPTEDQKKPSLYHSVRVWIYLYNNWYSEDLQIAWLLHDALEDTLMSEWIIRDKFWWNILEIVIANSKSQNLPKEIILEDIVKKCVNYWEDALIVKMADVYDNFLFYIKENNIQEIDRCKYISEIIRKHKPDNWNDKIFDLTNVILEY